MSYRPATCRVTSLVGLLAPEWPVVGRAHETATRQTFDGRPDVHQTGKMAAESIHPDEIEWMAARCSSIPETLTDIDAAWEALLNDVETQLAADASFTIHTVVEDEPDAAQLLFALDPSMLYGFDSRTLWGRLAALTDLADRGLVLDGIASWQAATSRTDREEREKRERQDALRRARSVLERLSDVDLSGIDVSEREVQWIACHVQLDATSAAAISDQSDHPEALSILIDNLLTVLSEYQQLGWGMNVALCDQLDAHFEATGMPIATVVYGFDVPDLLRRLDELTAQERSTVIGAIAAYRACMTDSTRLRERVVELLEIEQRVRAWLRAEASAVGE